MPNATRSLSVPHWVLFAILVAGTLFVYIPAMQGGFIWDDDDLVTNNVHLRTLQGLGKIWFSTATKQYYPLTFTSFWIEYQLWQDWATGYHITNVLLHCLCALLLWRVLSYLGIPGAWCAALVFALHPVHVESVAWISERKNTLSGVMYMISLLCYLRFYDRSQQSYYKLSLLFYVLAMAAKTVAASLPVAIWILLWWRDGETNWQRLLKSTRAFFVVGIPYGLFTVYLERKNVGAIGEEWNFTILERLTIAAQAWWFYPLKLLWPTPLCFVYPRWQIDAQQLWPWFLLILAAALLSSLWLLRQRIGRGLLAGLLFFSITIFPALGFFNIYPMRYYFVADHWQYLASLGIIVTVTAYITHWWSNAAEKMRQVGTVVAIGLAILLSVLTWRQGRIYKSQEVLWRDTLMKNPQAWMAHNNLGNAYGSRGELSEAHEQFQKALKLRGDHEAHNNLGWVYSRMGKWQKAVHHYQKAIALNSRYAKAYNGLGNIYCRQNKYQEAIAMLQKAISLSPENSTPYNNLGLVYCVRGEYIRAIPILEKAISLHPRYTKAHYNLAGSYLNSGQYEKALEHYERVLQLDPQRKSLHAKLAYIHYKLKRYKLAIQECDKAQRAGEEVDKGLLEMLRPYR